MSSPLLTMPGVVAYWQSGVGLFTDVAATVPAVGTDPVAAWVDRIVALKLAQATVGDRPARIVSGFKGGVGLSFTPPGQRLFCPTFAAHSGVTEGTWVMAMWRPRTDTVTGILTTTQQVMGISDQAGSFTFDLDLGGSYTFASYRDSCYHGKAIVASYDGGQADPDDRVRYRINRSDRLATWSNPPPAVAPSVAAGLTLGAAPDGTQGMTGTVLEVAYLDHALTQTEINEIEGYWAETFFAQGDVKVHVLGDSVSKGYPFNTEDGLNWPSRLAFLLGAPWTVQNVSIVAFTIAQMELSGGSIDQDRDEWRDRDVVFLCTGTNDGFQDHTAAQAIADMTISVDNRHEYGYEVWVECLPFAWPGGQGVTDPTQEEYDAFRATYNTAVRVGTMGHDGVFDLSAVPGFEQPINTSYYNADLTHMDAPGSLRIAKAVRALLVPPPGGSLVGVGVRTRRGGQP